jgi:hypothetical protein
LKFIFCQTSIASRERDSRQRGRFDLHQKAAVPVEGQQLHKCGVGGLLPCGGGARRGFGGGCDGFVARNIRQSQVVTRLSKIRLHII